MIVDKAGEKMETNKEFNICAKKTSPNIALVVLLSKKGGFVSGEEISEKLGITRSGVWKQVNILREMGYSITSSTKLGYRIDKSPDLLIPEEIWLKTNLSFLGNTIYYFTVLDSTNEYAKKVASEGAPHGALVVSEEQLKGRGRMGRKWISPKDGGLWFSSVLRPDFAPYEAPKLTILSAVAVAEAIRSETGLAAVIKWPNDVLIGGKKVCGILTELSSEIDVINHIIVGIGLNVNNVIPKELAPGAVSLKQIKKEHIDRVGLFAALLKSFETYYETAMNDGFFTIFQKWRSLCCNLGKRVKVMGRSGSFCGTALDINDYGALLVETEGKKVVEVLSGDVSLR
ncbi:MAG: biotin--[acetyl-CoA-carboxylase] ligase [Tepidanaerobacteraceae bacterium]|jgi:BirA family biotin operon repressor/biotin-[acetyl-CoA-carboxylase] ligase